MAVEPGAEPPVASAGSAASATEPAVPASSPAAAAPAAAPEPAPIADAAVQSDAGAAPAAAAAEPAAPAAPEAEPTLLQKFDAEQRAKEKPADKPAEPTAKPAEPAEAKPAEPAKPAADPAKPAEPVAAAPAEPAAPVLEPIEYTYELPETIKMDDATKSGFHTALDAFRSDPAKGAQGLIDLHNQTMTQYAEHLAAEQHRVWNETRKAWQTEVMADEQLGGAGYQTAMGAVARMRDLFVSEADMPAFDQFLKITGAGDHPAFLRMMHNAARIYDEAPLPPPDPRPAPNGGAKPTGRLRDMYKSNQRG